MSVRRNAAEHCFHNERLGLAAVGMIAPGPWCPAKGKSVLSDKEVMLLQVPPPPRNPPTMGLRQCKKFPNTIIDPSRRVQNLDVNDLSGSMPAWRSSRSHNCND